MEDLKQTDRASFNRAEQIKEAERPKTKPKEGKSPFDELLEQSRKLSQDLAESRTQTKTATREAVAEGDKLKERQRERSKDSEKEEDRKQDSGGERREGADGNKKVMGKNSPRQQQGQSKGGDTGDGSSGKKGEGFRTNIKKMTGAKTVEAGSHNFAKEFQTQLIQTTSAHQTKLPQEVLNQIVKAVRLGFKRDGTKVLELECGPEIFQGLRLRFHSKDGTVTLAFLTANPETRKLFEEEAEAIRQTLKEKGIVVESITVS